MCCLIAPHFLCFRVARRERTDQATPETDVHSHSQQDEPVSIDVSPFSDNVNRKRGCSQVDTYKRRVHTVLRSSYSHRYRQMLPLLPKTLTFRSNNVSHQPVTQALNWLRAHRDSRQQFVSCDEVPIDDVVRPQMQEILIEETPAGPSASTASTMRSACCRRFATPLGARRSESRGPIASVTPMTTCRPISAPGPMITTRR